MLYDKKWDVSIQQIELAKLRLEFLAEILEALDKLERKELTRGSFFDGRDHCAVGTLPGARRYEWNMKFDMAYHLRGSHPGHEVQHVNDDFVGTRKERYIFMRNWVESQLRGQ